MFTVVALFGFTVGIIIAYIAVRRAKNPLAGLLAYSSPLRHCLAGLETPDEGEIIIGDNIVFSAEKKIMQPPGKRNLGMAHLSERYPSELSGGQQ